MLLCVPLFKVCTLPILKGISAVCINGNNNRKLIHHKSLDRFRAKIIPCNHIQLFDALCSERRCSSDSNKIDSRIRLNAFAYFLIIFTSSFHLRVCAHCIRNIICRIS